VLDLNETKTVETVLVGIIEQTKGVEESKRSLGTKLRFKGVEGGGDLAVLAGAKAAADPMRAAKAAIFIMIEIKGVVGREQQK